MKIIILLITLVLLTSYGKKETDSNKFKKEYENNKLQKTVDGTDSYYKLLNYFDKFLEECTLTISKGKTVKTGEKRILASSFVYIEEGTTKKLVTGISDKQTTYNAELKNEILDDEAKTFKKFLNN